MRSSIEPCSPDQIRDLIRWILGPREVGVVSFQETGSSLGEEQQIYTAYCQFEKFICTIDSTGGWSMAGEGPATDGTVWLVDAPDDLNQSYTTIARELFGLDDIVMRCEVTQTNSVADIRRFVSNYGLIFITNTELTEEHRDDRAEGGYKLSESKWDFQYSKQSFRVVAEDHDEGLRFRSVREIGKNV